MTLAPVGVPGLSSLAPSAEEEAQWGITPPAPPPPRPTIGPAAQIAPAYSGAANATANATAGAYGPSALLDQQAQQQFAREQATSALVNRGGAVNTGNLYQQPGALQQELSGNANPNGSAFDPVNQLVGQNSNIASAVNSRTGQAITTLGGSEIANVLPEGTPGIVRTAAAFAPLALVPSALGANSLREAAVGGARGLAIGTGLSEGGQQLGIDPAISNVAAAGLMTAAPLALRGARGLATAARENPALGRLATEEAGGLNLGHYMDDNGILRDASGRPIGRQYPWSESNPTGYGKPEAPAPATSPAASSPPTSEVAAGQPAPAGAGPEPPLNDLERQIQHSLKGMTKPQVENLTTADMRAALDEAGLDSSGSPAKVSGRYRGMVAAGKGGINTPAENVSNAARDAYSKALAQTGDPGQATLAARRAAAIENASNARASEMQVQQAGLLQTLKDKAANLVKEEDGGSTFDFLKNTGKSVVQLAGDMISLKSSLSPPLLRQGKVSLVTRPVATMREFFQSMKAGFSEQTGRAMQDAIENDPWVRSNDVPYGGKGQAGLFEAGQENAGYAGYTWKDTGGAILDWGEDSTADTRVEERAVGRSSPLGTAIRESAPIKASDRQASVELNLHRTGWYREVASQMWKAGERDVNRYTELRQFIEHATQRGGWSQPSVPLFFSTRAQSGRAQFFWDVATKVPKGVLTGKVLQPGVEQQATRALVGMTAANMAMMGSLAALGLGTVTINDKGLPTFKRGNFHWDPWAGWNPQAKFILGIGHDIKAELDKHSVDGTWAGVPQDFTQRFGERAIGFLRKGLSPFYSTVASTYTGEDALGKPFNLAQQARSGQLEADWTLPFVAQDVADAYKDGGPVEAAVAGAGSSLSEGTSVYPPPLGEQRDAKAQELYGKNYGDLTDRASRHAVDDGINHVQTPFWTSSLGTVPAVDQALTQIGPKYGYAVTFGSFDREINQDDNSRKAWNASKQILDGYTNHLGQLISPQALAASGWKAPAQRQGESPEDYKARAQADAESAGRLAARTADPKLDAWIVYWGGSDTLRSQAAGAELGKLMQQYGNKPPRPGFVVKMAKDAK